MSNAIRLTMPAHGPMRLRSSWRILHSPSPPAPFDFLGLPAPLASAKRVPCNRQAWVDGTRAGSGDIAICAEGLAKCVDIALRLPMRRPKQVVLRAASFSCIE